MRELVYFVAVSLDGRIAGPGDDFSAFDAQGDHMAWHFEHYTDALPAPAFDALGLQPDGSRLSTVVMGWNTYAVGLPAGLASPYPHLEQVVFTRRHAGTGVPAEVRLVDSDPVAEVARLKEQDGSAIWLCGGGVLAAALAEQIDRMVLKVNPLVLGDGVPLFDGGPGPRHLRLAESHRFGSGVLINEYVR